MPKRPNPFGEASPLQFKTHIGKKEVDMGVNMEENMQSVYERTKDLLFQGSKKTLDDHTHDCNHTAEWNVSNRDGQPDPQPLHGQLRLDGHGQLHVAEEGGDQANGCIDTVPSHPAAAAAAAADGRLVESEEAAGMSCGISKDSADVEMAMESEENVACGKTSQGQLLIDPAGRLCASIKDKNTQQSTTMGFRICHSCNRPSNVGTRYCSFCDKLTCTNCVIQCHRCHGLFCQLCSILNYEDSFEKSVCLQCSC